MDVGSLRPAPVVMYVDDVCRRTMKTIVLFIVVALGLWVAPAFGSVETETVQKVVARNVKPNQRFSTSLYVHYAGYSTPYVLSYDEGASSNAFGTFKAFVPMEYLEGFYGPLRPVEYVE